MSSYFQNFPTIQYDVFANGRPIEVIDLFRAVRLRKRIRDNVLLYSYYTIQDGERPDHVSLKLYGSTDYYWTFFMVNDELVNLIEDWPLSLPELENKIKLKYAGKVMSTDDNISTKFKKGEILQGLVSGATATILEKDTNLGLIKISNITGQFSDAEIVRGKTSNDTFLLSTVLEFKDAPHHFEDGDGAVTQKSMYATAISNAEYEHRLNETKTNIRVIRPEYIQRVVEEFFTQINPEAQ